MSDSASADQALVRGWLAWSVFVVATLALMGLVVGLHNGTPGRSGAVGVGVVFALALIWSLLAVPAALLWRGHVVKAMWESRPADPEAYVKGLVVVWGAAEVGAVLALIGCLTADALLPGVVLAGGLLCVIAGLHPSRSALGSGLGVYPVRRLQG